MTATKCGYTETLYHDPGAACPSAAEAPFDHCGGHLVTPCVTPATRRFTDPAGAYLQYSCDEHEAWQLTHHPDAVVSPWPARS